MNDNVRVEVNNSKKKSVSLKNIEPVSNIKVVRSKSPSISDSEESLDSSISDISSDLSVSDAPKRKTKKVLKQKHRFEDDYSGRGNSQPKDYGVFSNPKKMNKNIVEDDEGSEYSSESSYSSNGDNNSEGSEDNEESETKSFEAKQKLKQDLLLKISALESKGFEFSKKYNMHSNYEEMMFDYERIKKFIDVQASIKFSRRCLMACVTGLEFLNKKFDPFNVKLEGWSENVMESIDDYDNIFERLHEKYSSKTEMAPEVELLLTLGGSGFMFHLTNTLLRTPSMTEISSNKQFAQNSPNFMQNMMGAMSQSMKDMKPSPPQQTNQSEQLNNKMPTPMETRTPRREMNGPTIDPNLFAGTPLMSNYPKPPAPQIYQQKVPFNQNNQNLNRNQSQRLYEEQGYDDDDRYSLASSSDSSLSTDSYLSDYKGSSKSKSFVISNSKKGGGGKKKGGIELNIK